MALIDLDEENYVKIKKLTEKDNIEFPSMKNTLNKIVREYFKKNGDKNVK